MRRNIFFWSVLESFHRLGLMMVSWLAEAAQSFLRVMKEDRNNLKKRKSKSKKKQNQRRNGGGQFTKVNEVGDAT